MKQPAISLIVPIYNGKDLLPACLTSIAAQTFRDFECIVVDDGSTDGTAEFWTSFCAADARFIPPAYRERRRLCRPQPGALPGQGEYICLWMETIPFGPAISPISIIRNLILL